MLKILAIIATAIIFAISCSSRNKQNQPKAQFVSNGIHTGMPLDFSTLIVTNIDELKNLKQDENIFVITKFNILDSSHSKAENIKKLNELEAQNVDVVSLTFNDLVIISNQEIELKPFKMKFLNSSIYSVEKDSLYRTKEILPFLIYKDVAFLGISKNDINNELNQDKFFIADYTLSILQIKLDVEKSLKRNKKLKINSYVIIHDLGNEISQTIERLPSHFINY